MAVTAGLLAPGPALFSLWHCDQDTDTLGLSTVTARRGLPSRRAAAPHAAAPAPSSWLYGSRWLTVGVRSLGGPFAEAVFADERCGFAVSLPTAAEVPGAEDFSLGFVGWLLLGWADEAAWEARRGAHLLFCRSSLQFSACSPQATRGAAFWTP